MTAAHGVHEWGQRGRRLQRRLVKVKGQRMGSGGKEAAVDMTSKLQNKKEEKEET